MPNRRGAASLLCLSLALSVLCGCQETPVFPVNSESSSVSSSQPPSPLTNAEKYFRSVSLSSPIVLGDFPSYDLQIAAENAVQPEIDTTPTLTVPLTNLTTLFLDYSFENADVRVFSHPNQPELLLFYYWDTENQVSWVYQYNLETNTFVLLNQLGFSATTNTEEPFWAGNVLCHRSDITSSDQRIQLSHALCCFHTDTNKWSFYSITKQEQAVPLSGGEIVLVNTGLDGLVDIYTLNMETMEATFSFSLEQLGGFCQFVEVCPDDTLVFSAAQDGQLTYYRYSAQGKLLSTCPSNPDLSPELMAYQLYRACPAVGSAGKPIRLSFFNWEGQDYVMPWRPPVRGTNYPRLYANHPDNRWQGLVLISQDQELALWDSLFTLKDTPDYLIWNRETDQWGYINLDAYRAGVTVLRAIPLSGNRLLLQTRRADNQVIIWKLLDLHQIFPLAETTEGQTASASSATN